jgi:hypothetical protein
MNKNLIAILYNYLLGRRLSKEIKLNEFQNRLQLEEFLEKHFKGRTYFTNQQGNLKYYKLIQDRYRQFYDCLWRVEVGDTSKGTDKLSISLTFDDFYNKDMKRVMELLISCDTVEDVRNLDQRGKIYYD